VKQPRPAVGKTGGGGARDEKEAVNRDKDEYHWESSRGGGHAGSRVMAAQFETLAVALPLHDGTERSRSGQRGEEFHEHGQGGRRAAITGAYTYTTS
jgi:hypothetical protein